MPPTDYLSGQTIEPARVGGQTTIPELIDGAFGSYNAGRLREGCLLFTSRMLEDTVMVGLTMTGALTPTGLGVSTLIPLIEAGFIDWIVATGGNLYHDAHFGLGLPLHRGTPFVPDAELRDQEVIRIYDIFFDYRVLLDTDSFFSKIIRGGEFQRPMSTAEFHHLCGGYLSERERALGQGRRSLLAACHDFDVPIYTPSPGDSSIGLSIAAAALEGSRLALDPSADVNEMAALFLDTKRGGGASAVLVLGGGSPKNFILQIEPYLQEILGIEEGGHDFFLQITDTRPDTGSLSGAPPATRGGPEGVATSQHDGGGRAHSLPPPDQLPDAVTCYADATIAFPLLAAYALANREPRVPKRLYRRRAASLELLQAERERSAADEQVRERARHGRGHRVTLERDR